ncbi:MAG TPA: GNAT family N-acetyltransferase [Pseudonocardiaceae bacterium]|jgi:RimJ/RimL family protein N-acetyltransferase|nr:GNAT family N-acetyltransferase [Pseudonocardiaceae bacterium]
MDAVEINAGTYYLRQLRADDLIDDRPALVDAFADVDLRRWVTRWRIDDLAMADEYVAKRAGEWAAGERCSWAIAEPTTGALLGEVDLIRREPGWKIAEAGCWVGPQARGRGVAPAALSAALRFASAALPVRQVDYLHAPDNLASEHVAGKCGFIRQGLRDGLVLHTLKF